MIIASSEIVVGTILLVLGLIASGRFFLQRRRIHRTAMDIKSVNWHFTRRCNYSCDFCYHTAKSSHIVSVEEGNRAIRLLAAAGTKKLNFSGGEPFLYPRQLGIWCATAKSEGMYVSIITNGSKVTEEWICANRANVDMLGISVDSSDDAVHQATGRWDNTSVYAGHRACALQVSAWCRNCKIPLKINTVVTTANVDDDMHEFLALMKPQRWKVFQCLLIEGENKNGLRDAKGLPVSGEQFQAYVKRHSDISFMKVEDNATMRNSYVILDENLRFLNNANNRKDPSKYSILERGVQEAFRGVVFDESAFLKRDGAFFNTPNPSPYLDIEDM